MDKKITILKGLGILAVVMGHKYFPFSQYYHPYSYHMALFIFVSGYLYKESYENNFKVFFQKRVLRHLANYYKWNLFYAILTVLIFLKLGLILGELPTLNNFFIRPFTVGDQFSLYSASWFIVQLVIIQFLFFIIHKTLKLITKNPYILLVLFLGMTYTGIYLSNYVYPVDNRSPWITMGIRTLFGLGFFYVGFFFKTHLDNRKFTYRFEILVITFLIQFYMWAYIGNLPYAYLSADFHGNMFTPIISSLNGIYLCLWLSNGISKFISDKDVLSLMGKYSYDIMNHHILGFFIFNLVLYKLGYIASTDLVGVYYGFDVDNFGLWYIIWTIAFCLGFISMVSYLKKFLYKNIINKVIPKGNS